MRDEQMHREQVERDTGRDSAFPDGQAEVDVQLAELAGSCDLAEPAASLRQRILDRATAEVLITEAVPARGRRLNGKPNRPSGRKQTFRWQGAMAIAASLVLGVVLWQPWGPDALEPPFAGVASVEVPEQAWVRTQRYAHVLSPATDAVREPAAAAPEMVEMASTTETQGPEAMAAEDSVVASTHPSLQWPPEVLAAAQRYAASYSGLAEAEPDRWGMEEIPLRSVRVQMPADDLWRMGLSAMPEPGNRRITADFLVQENGRPLAVRLVGMDQ